MSGWNDAILSKNIDEIKESMLESMNFYKGNEHSLYSIPEVVLKLNRQALEAVVDNVFDYTWKLLVEAQYSAIKLADPEMGSMHIELAVKSLEKKKLTDDPKRQNGVVSW